MKRSEPELLLDAKTLVEKHALGGIGQPGMLEDVRDLLSELHGIGSSACEEAARRVSRAFSVVHGGKR